MVDVFRRSRLKPTPYWEHDPRERWTMRWVRDSHDGKHYLALVAHQVGFTGEIYISENDIDEFSARVQAMKAVGP